MDVTNTSKEFKFKQLKKYPHFTKKNHKLSKKKDYANTSFLFLQYNLYKY